MRILIKHIVLSILEKKLRTILIILAVTLSATLFFASTSISDNLVEVYKKKMVQTVGNADIIVKPDEDSPSPFLNPNLAKKISAETEYIIKGISSSGEYKIDTGKYDLVSFLGMNLDDYKALNDLVLISSEKLEPFRNNKIIISKYTSDKYNLKIGDTMEFLINDVKRKFRVSAIAAPTGLFLSEANTRFAIVPFDTMSNYIGTNGNCNMLYVKGNGTQSADALTNDLKQIYSKYEVAPPFTKEKLDSDVSAISVPLMLVTVIISFLSIFIVYSSFKVIIMQKLPIIGTFRSIGASKKTVVWVMVLESLFYGTAGGLLACVLGIVVLYFLILATMPGELRGLVEVQMNVSVMKMILTFLSANLICLISSIIPIIKVSKIPVKEIVLNSIPSKHTDTYKKSIIGIVLIFIAAVLPQIAPRSLALPCVLVAIVCIFAGIINALPLVVKLSAIIFEKLSELLFGNVGIIATKNIRGNKSILNSISLITISISVLLMVNTASSNLSKELINAIGDVMVYDLGISFQNMDRAHVSAMARSNNVKGVYPYYQLTYVECKEFKDKISLIDGVSRGEEYSQYMSLKLIGDQKQLLEKLQEDRNIIVTKIFQRRYNLNVGDKLTFKFPKGNKVYTVIGFTDTMMSVGSYALIGDRFMKMDSEQSYYTGAYINVNEKPAVDAVKEELRKKFKGNKNVDIYTMNEYKGGMKSGTQQLSNMLIGLSLLALFLGIVGVSNNLIISFIERRQSIAVLKSVGMSKKQVVIMLVIEALCTGTLGAVSGILGGSILVELLPLMMEVMKVIMPVRHLTETFYLYLLGGICIPVITSLTTVMRSAKLNIVEAIKYE